MNRSDDENGGEPFNCPKCGAHDFGLNKPRCPHCGYTVPTMSREMLVQRLRGEALLLHPRRLRLPPESKGQGAARLMEEAADALEVAARSAIGVQPSSTPTPTFATHCADGQECGAKTTGCQAGNCQRRIAEPNHKALYMELLYAVASKFPNETRHQTALRYIKQRENPPAEPMSGCAADSIAPSDRTAKP